MKYLRVFLFPLLSLLIAAAIACGDDDEAQIGEPDATSPAATREDDNTPEATDDDTGGPTGAATGLDDEVQVQAADFSFTPVDLLYARRRAGKDRGPEHRRSAAHTDCLLG